MSIFPRIGALVLAAAALSACTTTYTGPVEVTRFVADNPAGLGQGPIHVYFPEEMSNQNAKSAFRSAIEGELRTLGYTVVAQEGAGIQVATVRTSRSSIDGVGSRRGPVSVGVGGSTGSYGSGVGVGLGVNLGGSDSSPRVVSELAVRITDDSGEVRWEGRAEQPVSIKSTYADVDASARTLAAALFRDFPGGNGETVTIEVEDLD
ncbi:MAG: DUF4136 domain-containing protein [Erythrobacter sp.]